MSAPAGSVTVAGKALSGPLDVPLICSAGGYLMQLFLLREALGGRSLLAGQDAVYAYGPTTRLAWRIVRRTRPAAIVTTGAAVGVPFARIGRLLRAKVNYVENLTRVDQPSLNCRFIRPFAYQIYVQWPELQRAVSKAKIAADRGGAHG